MNATLHQGTHMADIESVPLIAKSKKDGPIQRAAHEYKEAYREVYGVYPSMRYQAPYVRIVGQNQGVTLRRLREMTSQLRRRAPDPQ